MKNLFFFLSLILLSACSPKIYIIDRPTILESEVGGDWPSVDVEKSKQVQTEGPMLLPKSKSSTNEYETLLNAEN